MTENSIPGSTRIDPVRNKAKHVLYENLSPVLSDMVRRVGVPDFVTKRVKKDVQAIRRVLFADPYQNLKNRDESVLREFAMQAQIPGFLELNSFLNGRGAYEQGFQAALQSLGQLDDVTGVSLEVAYQASHHGRPVYDLDRQVLGGYGTAGIVVKLLTADLYRQLISLGVSPDERPRCANDLILSKGFLASCLLIARNKHLVGLNEGIESMMSDKPGETTHGRELDPDKSPITITIQKDGTYKCVPNQTKIDHYWKDEERVKEGTEIVGCPGATVTKSGDGNRKSAIQVFIENMAEVLVKTDAFEEYENYMRTVAITGK